MSIFKKINLSLTLALFLLLINSQLSLAVSNNQTQGNQKKLEVQEQVQDKQVEREQNRAQIAEFHANRLERRFTTYYNRLNRLSEKIANRLSIMSQNGQDVSAAQTKLTEANSKLEEAKSYGNQAINQFRLIEADKYQTQRELALTARDLANQARQAFINSLKLYKEVVQLTQQNN